MWRPKSVRDTVADKVLILATLMADKFIYTYDDSCYKDQYVYPNAFVTHRISNLQNVMAKRDDEGAIYFRV